MATYWVSTTGNDANDGLSKATAWATLTHAIANSADGDTIMLADGTYDWTLNDRNGNGPWQFNAQRTFRAETTGGVIFDANNQEVRSNVGTPETSPLIDGIHFRNAKRPFRWSGVLAVASRLPSGGEAVFERCRFTSLSTDFGGDPFSAASNISNSFLLRACVLEDWWWSDLANPNAFWFHQRAGSMTMKLHNCTLAAAAGSPLSVIINTLDAAPLAEFVNCIFYSASQQWTMWSGYYGSSPPPQVWRMRSCCLFNTTYTTPPSPTVDEANILQNTDPQFVDVAAGDYNLLPTSPCIDAGEII